MSALDPPVASPREAELTAAWGRREFLLQSAGLAAALLVPGRLGWTQDGARVAMKICLTPGSIGVQASQSEAIELAERYGFDAVEPFGGFLASLSDGQIAEVAAQLRTKGLVWGAAGLPVDFRRDDRTFQDGLKELPRVAAALAKAGADRIGTWLSPGHNELTYRQNLRQHSQRLRQIADVLGEHGHRFGLEYVGTWSLRSRYRYPFVHSLSETRELLQEIGAANVGLVLDSWHWWQADETGEEIASLENRQVVSVDLNDAPAGIAKREQQDGQRELPGATGVIEIVAFLRALERIGYDGPIRAEPFNQALNALENDAACQRVARSMRSSLDLLNARASGNGTRRDAASSAPGR